MRYLSICSGIEAASVALEPIGFEPVLYSEIERFPRAVLKYRLGAYALGQEPKARVPLWGDFTALRVRHLRRAGIPLPELLIGGTPCQSFSIAGLRGGLSDARGNLTLMFVRLAHALRNAGSLRWIIWENVPGVLNHPENPFGCFLGGLAGADAPLRSPLERGRWPNAGMVAGPRARIAWRVFNAQHFGLAQRRERVFVVAGFGDGADPAAVLFERKGLRGNFAPRREQRKDVAPTISARPTAGGGLGTDFDLDGGLIAHALLGEGFDASEDGTGRGTPIVPVAFNNTGKGYWGEASGQNGFGVGEIAPTLPAMSHAGSQPNAGGQIACAGAASVRRLTPRECERLMGFPDCWTRIPVKRYPQKPVGVHFDLYPDLHEPESDGSWTRYAADGPRYKSLGNSFAVPVIRWIGERIAEVARCTAGA